jgi:hypothetical protein
VVRLAFYLLVIAVVGSALFLCASKVELAALVWRFDSGELGASKRLQSLGDAAQKEVQKYCYLILTPALDDGTPGALSKLFILGETGQAALNNYFAKTLSETAVEIPVSTSRSLPHTLSQDAKHFLFLNRDGTLEVAGEAFEPNAPAAGSAALFVDRETPFEHLLTVLETLAKENTRTVHLAASAEGKLLFAKVELTTPAVIYTLFPHTLVALSDENSFFNHTKTSDSAAFARAIERAREEAIRPNFYIRFIVAETVHFDTLFKLITFCIEKETSPLFKLLTDEDAFILNDEAERQGLKQ